MPSANIKELNARIVDEYKKMNEVEKAKLQEATDKQNVLRLQKFEEQAEIERQESEKVAAKES